MAEHNGSTTTSTPGFGVRLSMFVASYITVFFLVYIVWKSDLGEFAQGVITLILGRFLGYLDGMYSFEFNTTRSSVKKDETLQDIAVKATPAPRLSTATRSTDPQPPIAATAENVELKADTVTVTENKRD